MSEKLFVEVVTSFEGLHRWPNAPEGEGYLRNSHRHLFVVKLRVGVGHEEREIEINRLKRVVDAFLGPTLGMASPQDFGLRSCETFARGTAEYIRACYPADPPRSVECVVLEDGLLGAGCTLD